MKNTIKKMVGLIVVMIMLCSCGEKYYNEWIENNGNKYYYNEQGQMLKDCYASIYGSIFAFDRTGKLIIDEIVNIDGKYGIVNKTGALIESGWYKYRNEWYYLKNSEIQTGWIQDGGNWYYLDKNGAMCSDQWVQKEYYVDVSGHMLMNTQKEIGGVQYIFDEKGVGKKLPDYQLVVDYPSTLWANDCRIKINKLNLDLNDLHSGWNTIKYECDATVLELWYSNTNEVWLYYRVYDSDNYLIYDSFESIASNLNKSSNRNIKVKGKWDLKLGENKGKYRLEIYSYKETW